MAVRLDQVDRFLSLIEADPDFANQKIRPWVQEIASVNPGVDLLERILNIGRRFKIVPYKVTATFPNLDTIQVEPENPYFYVTKKGGEKFLVEAPRSVRFAHELIHLIHAYENPTREEERSKASTYDDMDTEEERLAITGCNHSERDSCSENSLLAALGLPLRVNHEGVAREPPTLVDIIKVGALGTLKEILGENPSQINFVGHCIEAEATTTLLSAASYFDQREMIDYLLANNVNSDQEDELGGSILSAIKNDHKELALYLIERGLNRNLKDRVQRTALDYLNQRPASRFDQRSKPLFKALNSICQGVYSQTVGIL